MGAAHLFEHAQRALRLGQRVRAMQLLRTLLAGDPQHAEAHALLALCLHEERRLTAALHEAKLALTLAPDAPLVHLALGILHTSRGEFSSAAEHLALARAELPHDAQVSLAFARLRHLEGDPRAEVEELERARSQAPDDADVLAELADAYRLRGRYAEAGRTVRAALDLEADNADALVVMGHLQLHRGDYEAARDHALWVLQNDAVHVGALTLLSAIKARRSLLLGLWWRYHTLLTSLGQARSMLVMVVAFGIYRAALVALGDGGHRGARLGLQLFWLGVCVYTWVGPGLFQRALEKELETVRLQESF